LSLLCALRFSFLLRFFTRPKESYRVWFVWMWSWNLLMRIPWTPRNSCAMEE
jgi:hypothetical protein